MRIISGEEDLLLLSDLAERASRARLMAFDFLIPPRLLRDPFQTNAATVAAGHKGNKFIQSIAFAMESSVWIVQLKPELLTHLRLILASTLRKVSH